MNVRNIGVAVAVLLATACRTSGSQAHDGRTSSADRGQHGEATASRPGDDPLMTPAAPGEAVKGHASDHVVSGSIDRLSAQGVSILSDRGELLQLEIVPETAISVEGRDATHLELREGQPVRASYNEVEGRDVAVEIHALPAPGGMSGGSTGSIGNTESAGPNAPGASGEHSGSNVRLPDAGSSGVSTPDSGKGDAGSSTDPTGSRR
jgi:hypothetical protein